MDQKLGLMPIALLILVLAVLGVGGATLFYPKKRVFAPPQIFQEQQEKTNTYPNQLENNITAPTPSTAPAAKPSENQPSKPKPLPPLPPKPATPNSLTPTPNPSTPSVPAYTLVAHTGEVFGAKIPRGWRVESNQSGIDIIDPADADTGVSGVVAVGWFGTQTPDGFIDFLLQSIGASNIKTENESTEAVYNDQSTGLPWVVKTRTFTFVKGGKTLKAKASAGVMNGYGQYIALMTAFQTTPEKWSQWAPTLERIAKSITIINPSMAGGAHTVRLPTAADLANDSSPLMEAWEYRNRSEAQTSHEFSDAIMGQETDLISPSTGQIYTVPFSAYDPTKGGYHNPNNYGEILVDPYQK
ncbi:hypothetical protein A3E06_00780 [Candidatus Giovannonibacteria bacterium RIFCSPHIGHO2_12_FULL_44_42]|nr:MAG: hypothetical protein UW28_C0004G0057 [Parcubacteria group bacterium GW2011_GWA2_44_13]OGF73965.1 MAG: hypothetical protein A3E06_00780 [Candidatus Giovannonibacteria bacterium RIFCSPHIGHO2_12_FULL_44_42]OGF88809.1 MAG: hypothetical protein A3I94_02285 [Candidatus Giovannonibacteria bacterium RIFCSPLOWO2_02_FULL_43_54]